MPLKYICLLLLLPFFAVSQKSNGIDSLQKYSYLIYGITDEHNLVKGTGFFIHINQALYIVTAEHVLTGWNTIRYENETPYPDTMYIRVYRKDNNHPEFIPINITKAKISTPHTHFYDYGDISLCPIGNASIYKIYTLDNMILNYKDDPENPDAIINYGFPVDTVSTDFIHYITTIKSKKSESSIYGDIHKPVAWNIKEWNIINKSDSINYIMTYKKSALLGPGYSGSPVFFIYKKIWNGSTIQKVMFGGLCFGGDKSTHIAYGIKPYYIKKLLFSK